MSMIGNYRRVSRQELADLQANPDLISEFLYAEKVQPVSPDRELSIDKAWHAIHFLLNWSPWEGTFPLVGAVLGGTPLGEQDVGYGPARFLTAVEVSEVSHAISAISADDLLAKFDGDVLNQEGIYPQGWSNEDEGGYIESYYIALTEFFRKAAEAGDAIVLYIN